jgi:hypothetical protein
MLADFSKKIETGKEEVKRLKLQLSKMPRIEEPQREKMPAGKKPAFKRNR